MIRGWSPVWQSLMGSLFTWGMTALGAAGVAVLEPKSHRVLDGSLGFAAGVMTAASFWSLLAPAIEITEESFHEWGFLPVCIGFIAGALFVYLSEQVLPYFGFTAHDTASILMESPAAIEPRSDQLKSVEIEKSGVRRRKPQSNGDQISEAKQEEQFRDDQSWKRIFLLILAITVHNIPEGLAVGVGFGAVGKSPSATFESASNLALGIGIQNFPEGLAVSLPLVAFGFSKWRGFWYGQLSGMVEPIAAVLGAAAVSVAQPILPYALSFAAGAMIYVVVDDIIPEAQTHGNGRIASWGAICGFIVMMSLDVALG